MCLLLQELKASPVGQISIGWYTFLMHHINDGILWWFSFMPEINFESIVSSGFCLLIWL